MVTDKALGTASKLARIMPNIKGPGQTTRRLIATVAYSQVLYAAPVLSDAVKNSRRLRDILEKVHRTCILRITSAYRTISTAAASVLAGVPPIDLVLTERKEIYEERLHITHTFDSREKNRMKNDARDRLIQTWQRLWDESDKGRWTHALIPNIKPWIDRKHGEINFYLTQVFSGHGNFGSYLKRFRKREYPICELCNELEDNVEHTIIECISLNSRRNMLPDTPENMTIATIINLMIAKMENWKKYSYFIEAIMKEKTKLQQLQVPNP